MRISKISAVAVCVAGLVMTTGACKFFDSGSEEVPGKYYVPDGTTDTEISTSETESKRVKSVPSIDTQMPPEGPGGYKESLDDSDYAPGFGKRIANVSFEAVYFAFDQNMIPLSESSKISAVADYLSGNPSAGVVIEGNCDSRGTEEYNRALGERRANAAKIALMDLGIAESRIGTISYGEAKPSVQGESEDAWRMNRRDEFIPVQLKK